MPFEGIAGFGDQDGTVTTFASARDFGNVAAGFVAGNRGLSWGEARLGFDALESVQRLDIASEGQPTQRAERTGYNTGLKFYGQRQIDLLRREQNNPLFGPKF